MTQNKRPPNTDNEKKARARDAGIQVGIMPTGPLNALTDIPGVLVGQKTIIENNNVRTGVTAVLPHNENLYQNKVPGAIYVGNGFGKAAGYMQIEELGTIETPIILTNTLSVGRAVSAVVRYTLDQPGNRDVRSVNAVVGEVNDGYLNDIRGDHVTEEDVLQAIVSAESGPFDEGSVGAGTGAMAFGYKAGIGTSSRLVRIKGVGQYHLGALVLANYGGRLSIDGVPLDSFTEKRRESNDSNTRDGSCVIVLATDAPVASRDLKRIAARALFGLARTGSYLNHGSGEYVIAFSTGYRIPHKSEQPISLPPLLIGSALSPFFQATIEATEEAVYNSLFMAQTITGYNSHVGRRLPLEKWIDYLINMKG